MEYLVSLSVIDHECQRNIHFIRRLQKLQNIKIIQKGFADRFDAKNNHFFDCETILLIVV